MKKVHTDQDQEAIVLANSAGERMKAQQVYIDNCHRRREGRRRRFQRAQSRFLKAVIALECCVIGVLLGALALMCGFMTEWVAVLLMTACAAGGGAFAVRCNRGQ